MLSRAWSKVSSGTIINCWRKRGSIPQEEELDAGDVDPPPGMATEEFQTWVAIDDEIPVTLGDDKEEDEVVLEGIMSNR